MDPKILEAQLKTNKIREGPIYKRTKFLQEWRERWLVLTKNYLLIFTNRNLKEMAQFIDLREVKTYKSYLRKDQDMIPAGFKLRTQEDMFYFCARNCNQKWTWLVSIERLMDFKYAGKSPYNNQEYIRTKGFMGQYEFERGKFDQPQFQKPKEPEKPKPIEKPKEQVAQQAATEAEFQKKLRIVEEQMIRLKQKEQQMSQKQRQQEEIFLFELNKLKKAQQSLRQIQLQVEEKAREAQRILIQNKPVEIIKEVYIQKPVEVIVQKQVQVVVQKQVQVVVEKPVQVVVQKQIQVIVEKQVQKPVETVQAEKLQTTTPSMTKRESTLGKNIQQLKKFYESKGTGPVAARSIPQVVKPKSEPKKQEKKAQTSLHLCRDRVVVNLLEEFHPKAYSYPGLKTIIEFLVNICAERSLGYQSYLIREAKANQNRFLFAQVLLQLINGFKNYEDFVSLTKIIEVLIFEAPGIFKINHFDLIKRKLVDLVFKVDEKHSDMPILLKTLYVVHKMKNLQKNNELKDKLTSLTEKMTSGEGKNWAKKLLEDV